jgi:hypothetical protein
MGLRRISTALLQDFFELLESNLRKLLLLLALHVFLVFFAEFHVFQVTLINDPMVFSLKTMNLLQNTEKGCGQEM